MHQNRVDPQGNILSTQARGTWLGNRGQLHGNGKTILRPFKHQAWIICLLQFKNRHRQIMAPNLWTELFFFDEATALAAGHRPCFECRRPDAVLFKQCWLKGNPQYGFNIKTAIKQIDEILHTERIGADHEKVTYTAPTANLPNGTFIKMDNEPYLVYDDLVYRWTPFGYQHGILKPVIAQVLTPRSIVNALRAGYQPQIGLNVKEKS